MTLTGSFLESMIQSVHAFTYASLVVTILVSLRD